MTVREGDVGYGFAFLDEYGTRIDLANMEGTAVLACEMQDGSTSNIPCKLRRDGDVYITTEPIPKGAECVQFQLVYDKKQSEMCGPVILVTPVGDDS